ncbi:type II secretion system protein [Lutibacter sp. B2]|nr:type II secretion system protein [Lutibacter sp. B2]
MKNIKKNNQGFTLVELLVVLGIMGIIISAMFSFFLSNYKTFYRADDQVEAQYEAQIATNKLIDNVIDAQKIALVQPTIEDDQWHNINKIIFKKGFVNNKEKEWILTTDEYDLNIIQFQIKLLGPSSYSKGNYEACKGIAIKITSKVNDAEVDMKNEVYFRNWKKP